MNCQKLYLRWSAKIPKRRRKSRCQNADGSDVGIIPLFIDLTLKSFTIILIQRLLMMNRWMRFQEESTKPSVLLERAVQQQNYAEEETQACLWSSISSCHYFSCNWWISFTWIIKCRHRQTTEPHAPPRRPPRVDKEVSKALVCLLWSQGHISSRVVKTYGPILHQLEAGAKVSQADVAVHIQQNVIGLDVPGRGRREETIWRDWLSNPEQTASTKMAKKNKTFFGARR